MSLSMHRTHTLLPFSLSPTYLFPLPYLSYLPLLILLLLPLPQGNVASRKPHTFYIGGVLSTSSNLNAFTMEAQIIDYEHLYLPTNVSLYDSTQIMDSNPIKTAITVCNKLIKERVYAIIVSKPESGDLSPASVSYTAGFYHIPVLGISSRDSAFSDKNIHVSFLRTVPPYSHQADVWVELLKHFQYKQIVFIHSSDTDGRSLLGRFQTRAQDLEKDDQEVKVERVEEFEPGQDSYRSIIQSLKECQARVFFLYATQRDAEKIFADAEAENMTGLGYAWIVTEQALNSSNIPVGALGLQLTSSEDEQAHIHDALHVLASALGKLYETEDDIEEAPSNCNSSGSTWSTGRKLFKYIREQIFVNGSKTGRVAFDAMGDRLFAEYKIINVKAGNVLSTVGNYYYSNVSSKMVINVDDSKIIWPGGNSVKPTGVMIPTHLKVLTIVERPFIEHKNKTSECDREEGWFNCPQYIFNSNTTKLTHMGSKYCCRGYCMDLLAQLASKCNFTYDVYLSSDSNYGGLERNNETGKQEWTGLIGELVSERADIIVAPLTINPERAQVMEFSKPFKYQGITILQKRQPRASQLVSFLQPFKPTLWVLVLVSVKVIAVCLYLLDRFSPFGRYSSDPALPNDEESLNLTAAIWFAWGVLLNSGIGEGTPRSFSARVLGMVWAGFAMIIVASYTANLAAFLVLDKPQTSLTGINDPRLRNPMENFTYATVKGSSVDMYFRRQVELSNMYRTMEGKHFLSPELAIDAVRNGSLKAFIWDSSRLEYEAARDCNLITAGELFGRSGYGVGLQKGSPWADRITLAILDFHESGYMESLDNKWILSSDSKDTSCSEKDNNSPATLGLENMRGVFILVGAGIVLGSGLILIEIIYHKHKMRKVKRSQAAKVAISRWKGTVERRRTLKEIGEKKYKKEPLKANGSSTTGRPSKLSSLSLSFDNLTRGCGESSQWHKVTHLVRPRSTASGLCHSPSTPRFLRSLPSAEFRRLAQETAASARIATENAASARLASENAATARDCPTSPITPLSVDFSKKRRRRPQSPDLLERCSPEGHKQSSRSDFSDYAPICTEGWIPPVDHLPAPPPPPRRRLKSASHAAYIASSVGGGREESSAMGSGGGCYSKSMERGSGAINSSSYSVRTNSNAYINSVAVASGSGGGSEVLCGSASHIGEGGAIRRGDSGVLMSGSGSGYISKGSSTNSPPPAYSKYQTSRYSIRKEIV